jgi:hypothetical protein
LRPQVVQVPSLHPQVGEATHDAPLLVGDNMQQPPSRQLSLPVSPVQHGSPGAPHFELHLPLASQMAKVLRQRPTPQQGAPSVPQAMQVPPVLLPLVRQVVPEAVQPGQFGITPEQMSDMTSKQQAWPTPPHAPQLPLLHAPSPSPHVWPPAMHTLSTQQPPSLHASPGQQLPPARPHDLASALSADVTSWLLSVDTSRAASVASGAPASRGTEPSPPVASVVWPPQADKERERRERNKKKARMSLA